MIKVIPSVIKKTWQTTAILFVTEIGIKMHNKIITPDNMFQINHNSLNTMFLKPVDKNEIINHLNSLKKTVLLVLMV